MLKKILTVLLCLCLLAALTACKTEPTPTPTPDAGNMPTPETGTPEEESTLRYSYPLTGTNVTVEVHKGNILYVKGTGAVPDFDYDYDQPWYEHGGDSQTERSDTEGGTMLVKTIIVEEGITEIGENAFRNMAKLETVSLPSTLQVIGYQAFAYCRNLQTVTGGNGVTVIEASAFRYCNQLADISLSSALTLVEESAFDDIILPGVDRALTVNFTGSTVEWQSLIDSKAQSGNAALIGATVTYAP